MPACPRATGGAYLEPRQQFSWPIPPRAGEAGRGTRWWGSGQRPAGWSKAAKGVLVPESTAGQELGSPQRRCVLAQHRPCRHWGRCRASAGSTQHAVLSPTVALGGGGGALGGSPHYARVSLVLGSPDPGTALQAWPHQRCAEGKGHLPPAAAKALPSAAQGTTRRRLWARAPCWLMGNPGSARTPGAFSATLLASSFAKLLSVTSR